MTKKKQEQRQFVECPKCGQPGNQPPGLKLEEWDTLEAVFSNDDLAMLEPQKLRCLNCGAQWPVPRGSITVRKAV
jgi:hypothetical protein